MTNFDQIKTLKRSSDFLRNLRPKYLEKIKEPSCDKHEMKFGGDDRFSVFSAKVFLDCHTGYYGNSSCSTMGSIDNKLAEALLNRVLNKMMPEILTAMADEALKSAQALVDKAEEEVAAMQAQIESIKQDQQ